MPAISNVACLLGLVLMGAEIASSQIIVDIKNDTGVLKYPESGTYPANDKRGWRIVPESDDILLIRFNFKRIQIESCTNCACDYVELYEGSDDKGNLIAKHCNQNAFNVGPYFVNGTSAYVKFISDYAVNSNGFELEFFAEGPEYTIPPSTTPAPTTPPVIKSSTTELNLTSSSGSIKHPKDMLYYQNYEDARWIFTETNGYPIRFYFRSISIEFCTNCKCDSLKLYSGTDVAANPVATLCGIQAVAGPYVVLGGVAMVRFTSDESSVGEGFTIDYTSVLPTTTTTPKTTTSEKTTLADSPTTDSTTPAETTADSTTVSASTLFPFNVDNGTVIYRPYGSLRYPENGLNYQPNENYAWLIDHIATYAAPINISVVSANIEDSENCTKDSLTIYDGPTTISPVLNKICGTKTNYGPIVSTGSRVLLHFVSDEDGEGTGFEINYATTNTEIPLPPPPQVNYLNETSGEVRYPASGYYENFVDVAWFIDQSSFSADKIRITIPSLNIEYCSSCSCDALTIYDGRDTAAPVIAKLCGTLTNDGPYVTTGNVAYLKFTSDRANTGQGFTFRYEFYTDKTTTPPPTAPTTFSPSVINITYITEETSGNISHPKARDGTKYNRNSNLLWLIDFSNAENTTSRTRIAFNFLELDVEYEALCNYDYVEIFDGIIDPADAIGPYRGNATLIVKTCGSKLPGDIYHTTGPTASVRFKSDINNEFTGFVLRYMTYQEIATLMPITATIAPPDSDDYKRITTLNGNVIHPEGAQLYRNNEFKLWHIDHRFSFFPRRQIQLTIPILQVQECDSCSCDYVELYNGLINPNNFSDTTGATLMRRTCGTTDGVVYYTTGPTASIIFKSDDKIVNTGFKISYSPTDAPVLLRNYTLLTNSSGTVVHPGNGASSYKNNEDIIWHIDSRNSSTTGVIRFVFTQIDIETCDKCACDYVEIWDGLLYDDSEFFDHISPSLLITRQCGQKLNLEFFSTGLIATIRFKSDSDSTRAGFKMNYQVVKDQIKNITTLKTGTSGVIRHPKDGGFYNDNDNFFWILDLTASRSTLKFSFDRIDIQSCGDRCTCDAVEIFDGIEPDLYFLNEAASIGISCGVSDTNTYKASALKATVNFRSDDSITATGFQLRYAVVPVVTEFTTLNETSATVRHPKLPAVFYSNNENAIWHIDLSQSSNRFIKLSFQTFNVEYTSGCGYDYLEVFDGLIDPELAFAKYGGNETQLGSRLCGSSVPAPIYSNGPTMSLRFWSDDTQVSTGFTFQYEGIAELPTTTYSPRVVNVTYVYETSGNISHPAIRGVKYAPNANIIWLMDFSYAENVTAATRIAFNFYELSIEYDSRCSYDYVEIFDGLINPSDTFGGTYLGDVPRVIKICDYRIANKIYHTTGPIASVRFRSDTTNEYNGFVMRYQTYEEVTTVAPVTATIAPPDSENYTRITSYDGLVTYPKILSYGNNEFKLWHIDHRSYFPRKQIRLTFNTLQVQSCDACSCDYVELYSGLINPNNFSDTSEAKLIHRTCGSKDAGTYYTEGPTASIIFKSDESLTYSGFTINFQSTAAPTRTRNVSLLTDNKGTIKHPSDGSVNYKNNEEWIWQIDARNSSTTGILKIEFTQMKIEECIECNCDFVEVWDGLLGDQSEFFPHISPRITKLCGTRSNVVVFSTGLVATVRFMSDSDQVSTGFVMNYLAIKEEIKNITKIDVSLSGGTVKHPANDGQYGDNENIFWLLDSTSAARTALQFGFDSLDVQACDNTCSCDAVEVWDGIIPDLYSPPATSIVLTCGTSDNNLYLASGMQLTINFRSDDSISGSGFLLKYRLVPSVTSLTILTDKFGTIKHPAPPALTYSPLENAIWHIDLRQTYPKSFIKLTFRAFNIESDTLGCLYDYLEVFDGIINPELAYAKYAGNETQIGSRLCGSTKPSPIYSTGPAMSLRFWSDDLYQFTGFTIDYDMIPVNDPIITKVKDASGAIVHPVATETFYGPNENYIWHIDHRHINPLSFIRFQWKFLALEPCNLCSCDFVELWDGLYDPYGDNSNLTLIGKFCSFNANAVQFNSTGPLASVRFKSNEVNEYEGFLLLFSNYLDEELLKTTPIPIHPLITKYELVEERFGVIKHPENASVYNQSELVLWHLDHQKLDLDSVVKVTFLEMDLDECIDCSCDFVSVFDGKINPVTPLADLSPRLTKLCGKNVGSSVYSSGPVASVVFNSDTTDERSGFKFEFKAIPRLTNVTTLTSDSGEIHHPDTGADSYGNNENEVWILDQSQNGQRPQNHQVLIKVLHLDVETTDNCSNDYLEIFDGAIDPEEAFKPYEGTNRRIALLCGRVNEEQIFRSTIPAASIRFVSNENVVRSGFRIAYEFVDPDATTTTTSTTTTTVTTTTTRPTSPWPRDDVLLGYWPLTETSGLSDLTGRAPSCKSRCNGAPSVFVSGPFGAKLHSHESDSGILSSAALRPSNSNSAITLSMFIRASQSTVARPSTGLFSFTATGTNNPLIQGSISWQESYYSEELFGYRFRPKLTLNGATGAFIGTYDLLQPEGWSFVAVVIENSVLNPCEISLYGRYGLVYKSQYKPQACVNMEQNNDFHLGYSFSYDGQGAVSAMFTSVAIACVSIHDAALSDVDIAKVHNACPAAQNRPSCGSPKLPFTAIPSPSLTEPKYGQFPWMVSVRNTADNNKLVCSAALIGPFHAITSASCFTSTTTVSDANKHNVRLADQEIDQQDAFEISIGVKSIKVHPLFNGTYADVAVIELLSSADFDSDYINTMCLPTFGYALQNFDQDSLYFYGWGESGRTSVIDKSSPRYVVGSQVNDAECLLTYLEHRGNLTGCFKPKSYAIALMARVPCDRDYGGPMMVPSVDILNRQILAPIGISNKHAGNCQGDLPSLYTILTTYMQWLPTLTACNLPGISYPTNCPI